MNIEEIKKIVRQEMEDCSPSVKEVLKLNDSLKYWKNECNKLEKENSQLNIIIGSAIEYIELNADDIVYSYDLAREKIHELNNILKGENDE